MHRADTDALLHCNEKKKVAFQWDGAAREEKMTPPNASNYLKRKARHGEGEIHALIRSQRFTGLKATVILNHRLTLTTEMFNAA